MFTKYQVDFLSIALKQTQAGPQSSVTPFLVLNYTHLIHDILAHFITQKTVIFNIIVD